MAGVMEAGEGNGVIERLLPSGPSGVGCTRRAVVVQRIQTEQEVER